MAKTKRPPLSGKLALISGGSSGIGLALAKIMAHNGASLIIIARQAEKLAQAQKQILTLMSDKQQYCETLSLDLRDAATVEQRLSGMLERTGTPDYVVHSAGVVYPGLFEKITDEQFHWMMDTNYFGAVNLFRVIVPLMKRRGSGHITAMGSGASFVGIWGYAAYSGSKYAVRGLCDVLRGELKPYGIRVSIIFPPDTDTPQLAYENQFKSPVTKDISGTVKPLSPEFVAEQIYQGMRKKRYVIIPDSDTRWIYRASCWCSSGLNQVLDFLTAKAIKKHGLE